MNYSIPLHELPEEVEVSTQLTPEEEEPLEVPVELSDKISAIEVGASFHEKSAKNSKEKTDRKSYQRKLRERYKRPLSRGDKIQNRRKKKK